MKFTLFATLYLMVIASAGLSMTGCAEEPQGPVVQIQAPVNYVANDFGNGVLYFAYTEEKFGRALAGYRAQHPEMRIVGIATNDRGAYGSTIGYFVVVEKR